MADDFDLVRIVSEPLDHPPKELMEVELRQACVQLGESLAIVRIWSGDLILTSVYSVS